jgi:hypothetical protein
MSKAAELAALIGSQTALSNRNLVINGAMVVDQRNATGQPVGGYGYGVDRFRGYNNGTARYDVSQEDITDLEGFSHCYKLAVTTTQSSYGSDISVPIEQSIEGHNTAQLSFGTSNAQTVTISFYVKSSVTGDFSCALFNGSPITRSIVQNWTVNSANTWERKTLTFAGDTSGTWRTDNLVGAYVALASIGGSSGTARASAANTWEDGYKNHLSTSTNIFATSSATLRFSGVQLELGEQATPFEHRSFGDELARCQRYYHRLDSANANGNYLRYNNHRATSTTGSAGTYHLPVKMRATPSIGTTGTASDYALAQPAGNTTCSITPAISGDGSGPDLVGIDANVSSGLTTGQAVQLMSNNNQTSFIAFDAEL